jgi:hypothetical protein
MKKRFGTAAIVLLCAVCASVPVLVYAQQTSSGTDYSGGKYLKARINVGENTRLYVGADSMQALDKACDNEFGYSFPLMGGPEYIVRLWNPNPELSPNIIKWMKDNKIRLCATVVYFTNENFRGAYVHADNGDGTFSTAIYRVGR